MTKPPRIAICAGSFDPLTNGHVDVITRSARLFDRVVVAVLINSAKRPLFAVADRVAMIREVFTGQPAIVVESFDGLLVDLARLRGASAVIRGLRTTSEFNEEWQMAQMNRHLHPDLETLFVVASPDVAWVSSRLVREIATRGGSLQGLVPAAVAARLTPGPGTLDA